LYRFGVMIKKSNNTKMVEKNHSLPRMSTFEITYEKDVTNKRVYTLLKQAAVDCEIHRKLHSRENPVLTCSTVVM
jgi:hypothetical protein